MQAQKTNLKKEDARYYTAKLTPEIIDVQEVSYISIQGSGEPGGEKFQDSVSAIFSLAYQLKLDYKKKGIDFSVPNLEATWWTESGEFHIDLPRDQWLWKVMIRIPRFVSMDDFEIARDILVEEKRLHLAVDAELEEAREGKFVQILHQGPYEEVGAAYEKLIDFAGENGLRIEIPYREIYLSDPSRTAPDRLRTIIRIPAH